MASCSSTDVRCLMVDGTADIVDKVEDQKEEPWSKGGGGAKKLRINANLAQSRPDRLGSLTKKRTIHVSREFR